MSTTIKSEKEGSPLRKPDMVGEAQVGHLHMPPDHMEDLYESKNPLVKFVHLNRLDSIAAQIPAGKEQLVLDAGCGEGHLLERLHRLNPCNHYYGVDVTPVALEKAHQRCPTATLKHANLSATEFPSEFFDGVICTEVLEHIYEYEAVIRELRRVLKPGGRLILTFPNEMLWTFCRFLLGRKPVKVPDHVNSFNPRRMKACVNLKLENQTSLPFKLPFPLSLSCLMKFRKIDIPD